MRYGIGLGAGLVMGLLLVACGGGEESTTNGLNSSSSASSSASSATKIASPTPTTVITVTATPTATVATSSSSSSSSRSGSASSATITATPTTVATGIYLRKPVLANCDAGELRDAERTLVLEKLNTVRARHGLLPVVYDASDNVAAAAAALYMVVNKELTHTPQAGTTCYTSEAARLAGTSNLYMSYGYDTETSASSDAIQGYLVDSGVESLGHRRWILSPFLQKVTFGRVDGTPSGQTSKYMSSVLKVVGNERSSLSGMSNDFVAYPYGAYPASEFSTSWYLSFSAIANTADIWKSSGSEVSYANATVKVTNTAGAALTVSSLSANYDGYGMPNHLQWKVAGLVSGVTYTVLISGVSVNGTIRSYTYTFSLN